MAQCTYLYNLNKLLRIPPLKRMISKSRQILSKPKICGNFDIFHNQNSQNSQQSEWNCEQFFFSLFVKRYVCFDISTVECQLRTRTHLTGLTDRRTHSDNKLQIFKLLKFHKILCVDVTILCENISIRFPIVSSQISMYTHKIFANFNWAVKWIRSVELCSRCTVKRLVR